MHHSTTLLSPAMRLAGLLSSVLLLPLVALAGTGDHIDYTFSGTLRQDRFCTFDSVSAQTVDFATVGFQEIGGGEKVLKPQTEKTLAGTAITCSGTGDVFLKFDVPDAQTEMETSGTFKTLKTSVAGIGIALFVNHAPVNFNDKITANPSHMPVLTVMVSQTERDGHSLAAGAFNASATLQIIYS